MTAAAEPLPADTGKVQVSPRRRLVGRIAVGIWAACLVYSCLRYGIPFDRLAQTLWILSGFAAIAIGRPWSRMWRVILDWSALIVVLYVYDLSRGWAAHLNRPVQVDFAIDADRLMFGGIVPTVWLQDHLYDPSAIHWWDVVASLIYITHFLVPWIIAAVLYLVARDRWFEWVRALVVLSFSALVVFVLFPTAPPWYADSVEGVLPEIARIATRGLDAIGLHPAKSLIDGGRAFANEVAAIPSLHTGFAVLVSLFVWTLVPRRQRWWAGPLLVAYPVAMIAVLVYSGEHYVIDGIIGAAFALATWFGLRWWDRYRDRRRTVRNIAAASVAIVDGPSGHAAEGTTWETLATPVPSDAPSRGSSPG